jgi:hypothetical protein
LVEIVLASPNLFDAGVFFLHLLSLFFLSSISS